MTPQQKKDWINAKVAEILQDLEKRDVVTESTCDHYNWDSVAYALMPDVANRLRREGVNVRVSVKWEVTDYTFV